MSRLQKLTRMTFRSARLDCSNGVLLHYRSPCPSKLCSGKASISIRPMTGRLSPRRERRNETSFWHFGTRDTRGDIRSFLVCASHVRHAGWHCATDQRRARSSRSLQADSGCRASRRIPCLLHPPFLPSKPGGWVGPIAESDGVAAKG